MKTGPWAKAPRRKRRNLKKNGDLLEANPRNEVKLTRSMTWGENITLTSISRFSNLEYTKRVPVNTSSSTEHGSISLIIGVVDGHSHVGLEINSLPFSWYLWKLSEGSTSEVLSKGQPDGRLRRSRRWVQAVNRRLGNSGSGPENTQKCYQALGAKWNRRH